MDHQPYRRPPRCRGAAVPPAPSVVICQSGWWQDVAHDAGVYMTTADVLLLALGAVAVGAAGAVVSTRHIVRAGLWLVVTLGAVAGLYLVLTAELVAWVQVLIYVGAVVVLLLFAVMLTRAPIGASDDLDRSRWPGLIIGGGAGRASAALLVDAYRWSTVALPAPAGAQQMGTAIFRGLGAAVRGAVRAAALRPRRSHRDLPPRGRRPARPRAASRWAGPRMIHPIIPYLVAAVLFGLGCYGVLVRRNAMLHADVGRADAQRGEPGAGDRRHHGAGHTGRTPAVSSRCS